MKRRRKTKKKAGLKKENTSKFTTHVLRKKNLKSTESLERDKGHLPGLTSENITQGLSPEQAKDSTKNNQVAFYAGQIDFLERETLVSTDILNESTKLLHSQTKSILGESSIFQKKNIYRLYQARQNMNTVARLIQVKVNMFKAISGR